MGLYFYILKSSYHEECISGASEISHKMKYLERKLLEKHISFLSCSKSHLFEKNASYGPLIHIWQDCEYHVQARVCS